VTGQDASADCLGILQSDNVLDLLCSYISLHCIAH